MPELPQIPATGDVQIPDFPKPQIGPGAGGQALIRGVGDVAGMVTDVANHAIEIRRDTQFNEAAISYDTQTDSIAHQLLRDPKFRSDPDAAQAEFNRRIEPLADQMRQQYPSADFSGRLTRNMGLWGQRKQDLVSLHAFNNQVEDTAKEGEVYAAQAQLGATDPNKPPEIQEAIAQHFRDWVKRQGPGTKDAPGRGLYTQGEADLMTATFDRAVAKGRFENGARQNPAQTLLLDSAHPPEGVLPEWVDAAKKLASEQLQAGSRAAVADADAKIGGLAQNAMALAGQPGEAAAWAKYREAGGEEKVYEAHTGRQFIRPVIDPALTDSYIKQIHNLPPDEIPYKLDEVGELFRQGAIGSKELQQINAEGARATRENATAEKQTDIQWRNSELAKYVPKGTDPMARFGIGSMAPKASRAALDSAIDAAIANPQNHHDPVKMSKEVDDQFRKYMLQDVDGSAKRSVGILVPGRTTGAP